MSLQHVVTGSKKKKKGPTFSAVDGELAEMPFYQLSVTSLVLLLEKLNYYL